MYVCMYVCIYGIGGVGQRFTDDRVKFFHRTEDHSLCAGHPQLWRCLDDSGD